VHPKHAQRQPCEDCMEQRQLQTQDAAGYDIGATSRVHPPGDPEGCRGISCASMQRRATSCCQLLKGCVPSSTADERIYRIGEQATARGKKCCIWWTGWSP
jgi:hypothetical protein